MKSVTLDANEAVASVAYRMSETIAIYPITPSSPMAEWCDEWQVAERPNLWGTIPSLVEMQSEAGVAGALHGMLQLSSLSTTFTASQGLLLMIPDLYKIAGELLPFCLHVTARTVATHALSIFGDHSDVMACRATGVAMLASNSVQEAQDMACIAHCATLATRIPFLHFFDGFRTSHEIARIEPLADDILQAMFQEKWLTEFRRRALSPEHPVIRGTAQNPDVFFQAREAANRFTERTPGIVQGLMDHFADLTGRNYELFQYSGHPEADRVIVAIGSGAETAEETARALNARGERTGVVKVRLYRPFSVVDFVNALPATVRAIAVLDRTKEPGAIGDPLYLDVLAALAEARAAGLSDFAPEPVVIGGRYGLSSKEFDPAMVLAVFDELKRERPRRHFTVGINDDVTGYSLKVDEGFNLEEPEVVQAVFYGLGADGTVGANKNSIKIIGEETDNYAQGYFVYDSKKSGAMTISHLRFGPRPIASHYLIKRADFVACHHFHFLSQHDVLAVAAEGATVLLNTALPPDKVWNHLPARARAQILAGNLRCFVIDAATIARESGLGSRINTIMQVCFFALAKVLPRDKAIERIKKAIAKTYERKGQEVILRNYAGVDRALAGLQEMVIPSGATVEISPESTMPMEAPSFVRQVTGLMLQGKGDLLPVSAFPVDGSWPVGTSKWEKRNLADEIPVWEPDLCIQCNKCALVCPHACIRPKFYSPDLLAAAPPTFQSADFRSAEFPGRKYTLQVAPEDCTGCSLCVQVCPVKDKEVPNRRAINMEAQAPLRQAERENYEFFLGLPSPERSRLKAEVKSSQFFEPLFEYSGACAGCGETPYLKLLTQLYGDRLLIANATGCSSIFGGNLPTTPYTTDASGRGPAWSNSLFEDNAEYGLGMRVALDQQNQIAREIVAKLAPELGNELVEGLLHGDQAGEAGVKAQRDRVEILRQRLAGIKSPAARRLETMADALVRKSVWMVGGDGWAYDIGFGGLDHVFSLGRDVNILVLDTECYSNTGGQQSKSTPLGASAKFAMAGKSRAKKDLGVMAMSYGSVYVARVALGAKDSQTVKAFDEAERFPGTSLIIAYSPCIAHGYAMHLGLEQQKLAVDSGSWPLYRFDPRRSGTSLQLDSGPSKVPLEQYFAHEPRFHMMEQSDPARFAELQILAQEEVARKWRFLQRMAGIDSPDSRNPLS